MSIYKGSCYTKSRHPFVTVFFNKVGSNKTLQCSARHFKDNNSPPPKKNKIYKNLNLDPTPRIFYIFLFHQAQLIVQIKIQTDNLPGTSLKFVFGGWWFKVTLVSCLGSKPKLCSLVVDLDQAKQFHPGKFVLKDVHWFGESFTLCGYFTANFSP